MQKIVKRANKCGWFSETHIQRQDGNKEMLEYDIIIKTKKAQNFIQDLNTKLGVVELQYMLK